MTVSRSRTIVGVAVSVLLVALLAAGVMAGGGGAKGGIKLTGAAERPGPGDPDGSGRAFLKIRPNAERVCFDVRWKNLDPVTMAHIHVGSPEEAGDIVVTLFTSMSGIETLSETRTQLRACTETFSPPMGMSVEDLLRDIKDNPEDYYVNVHSTVFPAGAIRGQLKG